MSYFSSNLKYLREKKKLSQNRLAEMAGVNQTTIARWETEEVSPSLDNIYDLAETLNVPIADLTGKDLSIEDVPPTSRTEILFNKTKDILNDDERAMIEATMERAIKKHEEEQNKGN